MAEDTLKNEQTPDAGAQPQAGAEQATYSEQEAGRRGGKRL